MTMLKRKLLPGSIDCHCHLSDARIARQVGGMLDRAREAGVANFALAGVGPEDWKAQLAFAADNSGVIPCFGLHPYFVAANSLEDCEAALAELETMLPDSLGVGECGLDFRPQFVDEEVEAGRARQRDFFQRQLRLADARGKVAILHVVRAHDDALVILGGFKPKRGFLVHAFNSSAVSAEGYLRLGGYLSVGGPLLREKNDALREAVRQAPIERLLVESDTPDQPPPSFKDRQNEPASILLVAERVGELKKLSRNEVLEAVRANFARLFHEEVEK